MTRLLILVFMTAIGYFTAGMAMTPLLFIFVSGAAIALLIQWLLTLIKPREPFWRIP